ncbi:hypothetical protein [Streptomyces sp. NPDC012510]|uniref:hypothetical protein n=1 Tax=Streptomyces sp. NPDC012510 TaxID=3364838 RepID=UPI0036E7307E
MLIAAHAWDLRGAQNVGLRMAHVARPVGDPPAPSDRFDAHASDLTDLTDVTDLTDLTDVADLADLADLADRLESLVPGRTP